MSITEKETMFLVKVQRAAEELGGTYEEKIPGSWGVMSFPTDSEIPIRIMVSLVIPERDTVSFVFDPSDKVRKIKWPPLQNSTLCYPLESDLTELIKRSVLPTFQKVHAEAMAVVEEHDKKFQLRFKLGNLIAEELGLEAYHPEGYNNTSRIDLGRDNEFFCGGYVDISIRGENLAEILLDGVYLRQDLKDIEVLDFFRALGRFTRKK